MYGLGFEGVKVSGITLEDLDEDPRSNDVVWGPIYETVGIFLLRPYTRVVSGTLVCLSWHGDLKRCSRKPNKRGLVMVSPDPPNLDLRRATSS